MQGPERKIPIGKIVASHGVRGAVKYLPYSGTAEYLQPGAALELQLPDGQLGTFKVAWSKPHNRYWLIGLDGVDDRDAAGAMKNAECLIERSALPQPEDDTYYWADLIGSTVYSDQGHYLGNLRDIIETGANDVYVVVDDDNEILVPAIATVVKSVDIENGRISVQLPDGL